MPDHIKLESGTYKITSDNLPIFKSEQERDELWEKIWERWKKKNEISDSEAIRMKDGVRDHYLKLIKHYESFSNPFRIYREIVINDIDDYILNLRNANKSTNISGLTRLGKFWTWNIESAKSYWGETEGMPILLVAEVNKSDINWKITLLANLHYWKENEVRLKEGTEIKLISIWTDKITQGNYRNRIELNVRGIALIPHNISSEKIFKNNTKKSYSITKNLDWNSVWTRWWDENYEDMNRIIDELIEDEIISEKFIDARQWSIGLSHAIYSFQNLQRTHGIKNQFVERIKDYLRDIKIDFEIMEESEQEKGADDEDDEKELEFKVDTSKIKEIYPKIMKLIEVILNEKDIETEKISAIFIELNEYLEELTHPLKDLEDSINEYLENIVKDIIHERFLNFLLKYEKFSDPFEIYRGMTMIDVDKYIAGLHNHTESVGEYWSWNRDSAYSWGGEKEGNFKFITLIATVEKSKVDWIETLVANLNWYVGEDEEEINLKSGTEVYLISIEIEYQKKERKKDETIEMGIKANT